MPKYDSSFTPPAPVARVTLTNPHTGTALNDVPMLLDSGADVTLIPEWAAVALGLDITHGGSVRDPRGPRYECSCDCCLARHEVFAAEVWYLYSVESGK